jgi:SAM-dependent methyltransferase
MARAAYGERQTPSEMPEVTNICAGPFGVFYDLYIERPWLAQLIGRTAWGVDIAPLYRSMAALAELSDDMTVLDVPCGGGVALRALRPGQRLRWIAVDIEPKMLARCERRARERGVAVELVEADMRALPLPDACADVCLAYSGLHMVEDAGQAVAELVRCLKPGGELRGATFVAEGSRRQRLLLGHGVRTGQNGPLVAAAELRRMLQAAGIADVEIAPERGLAMFRGRRVDLAPARSSVGQKPVPPT